MVVGKLPRHLKTKERKMIIQRSAWLSWIGGYIFHTGVDMHIRRCIREDEIYDILRAYHDEKCGSHFLNQRTGHKVLQMGYYWTKISKYAKKYFEACDSFQRMGSPGQFDEIPLQPQLVVEPFE